MNKYVVVLDVIFGQGSADESRKNVVKIIEVEEGNTDILNPVNMAIAQLDLSASSSATIKGFTVTMGDTVPTDVYFATSGQSFGKGSSVEEALLSLSGYMDDNSTQVKVTVKVIQATKYHYFNEMGGMIGPAALPKAKVVYEGVVPERALYRLYDRAIGLVDLLDVVNQ